MPNLLGKRFACPVCGAEVLCIKTGEGEVHCHDQPMVLQKPKPLPSSD